MYFVTETVSKNMRFLYEADNLDTIAQLLIIYC